MFGVFYQDQPLDGQPSYSVTLKEARIIKREKAGYFVNRGKSIRLVSPIVVEKEELMQGLKARDLSAQMNGPDPKHPHRLCITERLVAGDFRAIAIVEAWA